MPEKIEGPSGFVIDAVERGNKGDIYFCHAGKKRYVVKEYIMHRFIQPEPGAELSPRAQEINQRSQAWLEKMQKITLYFRRFVREDGLMNIPLRTYREGLYVYKVTYAVEADDLDRKKPWQLSAREVDLLIKTALAQLDRLAAHDFVHGDIKPDNLMIRRHGERRVAALIDYDGGFFMEDAAQIEDIDITPEYAAPELRRLKAACERLLTERAELARQVTPASDVYGVGGVYGFWLTGQAPTLNSDILRFPPMDPLRQELIRCMTAPQPANRPTAKQAAELLGAAAEDMAEREKRRDEPPEGWQWTGEAFSVGSDLGRPACRGTEGTAGVFWETPGFWRPAARDGKTPAGWTAFAKRSRDRIARAERTASLLNGVHCQQLIPFATAHWAGRAGILEMMPDGEPIRYEERYGNKPLSPATVDRIMHMILQAAEQVHNQGLILGTLSPETVWFCLRLLNGRRYLNVYLGHLWQCYPGDSVPPPLEIDLPAGAMAPEWGMYLKAAPEEREDAKAALADPRTDLWQLGCIYHFLLTGRKITSPREIDVGQDLPRAAMIRQAMRAAWFQRTPSCSDMLRQLENVKTLSGCEAKLTVLCGGKPAAGESVRIVMAQKVWSDASLRQRVTLGDALYAGVTDAQGILTLSCGIPYLEDEDISYLLLYGKKQIALRWQQEEKRFTAKVEIG